jgi:predicted DNA-binding transcriptional regulator YafY
MPTQWPTSEPKLEETKRTARLLQIMLMVAAAPRRYRRRDFVRQFEVSERMISKDIELISNITGFNLQGGRDGYYFERVPDLPMLHFDVAETLALLNAIRVAKQMSGVDSPELAAVVARIEALFPADLVNLLRQVSRPGLITDRRQHRQGVLAHLTKAWSERSKVCIVYETASRDGEATERIVHPYYLLPYVRSWQLIAYCEHRQAVRMFKLDRIRTVTILPISYSIPDDFDVATYMHGAWGMMRADPSAVETVLLRFTPEAGRWVAEEDWHPSQQVRTVEDGCVLFQVRIAITPEFVNWLLYYGAKVEVLGPEHLRRTVSNEHQIAAEIYRQSNELQTVNRK